MQAYYKYKHLLANNLKLNLCLRIIHILVSLLTINTIIVFTKLFGNYISRMIKLPIN